MWLHETITCHTSFEYSYCGQYLLDQDCIKQRKYQVTFRVLKKCKIYFILLLWFIFKHCFVVYLYKEHNARISSCAWNMFYLHFAYVWMLWYRSLTLCQMKQLWTVISTSYLILGLNSLLHGTHRHPYTADHSWSIYSLLSCIWKSACHQFNTLRRDTCESIPHNLKAFCGSLPPQHTCRRIHINFHLISLEPYICLIVGKRKV